MLNCTRRELIAAFLGAPLLAATASCDSREPTAFAGSLQGQNLELGHKLRDGLITLPQNAPVRSVPVVIVGGGIAGLSAAWRLARERSLAAPHFEILELEEQAGGTSRAGHNAVSAYPWGAHYLPCPLPHARAAHVLLRELGISSQADDGSIQYDEAQLVRAPHERVFIADRWYEGQFPLASATERDQAQLAQFEAEVAKWVAYRDLAGLRGFAVPLGYASSDPEVLALDQMTFAEWLERRGLDSPRLRWWLEYGTRDDMGATLQQTSAYAGLHYHAARATSSGASEFLTWPEGNGRLVAALAHAAGHRLRKGQAVLRVQRQNDGRYQLHTYSASTGAHERLLAEQVIFAMPQSVVQHVLEAPPPQVMDAARVLTAGSWLVANMTLRREPASQGFPLCWDNVLYGSASVGYVVATHQTDRAQRQRNVWTWYLPLTGADARADRLSLQALDFAQCAELVVSDLSRAHRDIRSCIERIDVFRWGHAIVRPTPGLYAGEAARLRRAAQRPHEGLHFAHTELSGLALFEEAQWHGVRAAEEVLAARGVKSERLV